MMTNLFSTFDPATSSNISMNWMSMTVIIMLMPMSYWMMPNRINSLITGMIMKLNIEFKTLMGMNASSLTMMMISLFMFILMNNFMGLLPYIFTSSSHMTFTLTLSLPMWLSLMIYGWVNKTNQMFAHMIPVGTPVMLMPFMVIIETMSNMIRPGALAVRLMANMIAGHLLMSLLGNNLKMNMLAPMIIMIQMTLMLFEMAVAVIQSYVFSVLMTLYTSELT
uniref:ATP synthase subunit a n=1 Tax=Physopelta slanbuschii TaxID=1768093 RepID=A0A4Y1JVQ9_9HEMI|nr:ATP synthase F0 subunit 6 [Physopelta slanbuschii]APO08823.1 ATP synthase F0 subunit 6 [Physopelta slanbuschii]